MKSADFESSVFLSNVHHAYAQTDGTYKWPNSREGDMLRQAKAEIERLQVERRVFLRELWTEAGGHPNPTPADLESWWLKRLQQAVADRRELAREGEKS
jgi:hypothetical protein